ncbi:MAG: hypothetical protein Q8P67_24035, partial [archaeon]|nr:hypothetical protein [archaeon]
PPPPPLFYFILMMLSLIFRRFPQVTSFQRTLATAPPPAPFVFQEPHPLYTAEAAPYDETPYRLLTTDFVRKIPNPLGYFFIYFILFLILILIFFLDLGCLLF